MGQCVSRKGGAVIAASGHHDSPSYRRMEKPFKNKSDNKTASKNGAAYTKGTAMSFGFRRRPTSGIPMPVASNSGEITQQQQMIHQRSKSAGPEQGRRHDEEVAHRVVQNSSSGRSTPRLAPPRKEASGLAVRTNRFGFRQPPAKFTNKVADVCTSHHTVSHYNQEKYEQENQHQASSTSKQIVRASQPSSKLRPSPVNPPPSYNNPSTLCHDANKKVTNVAIAVAEPVGRYTLHSSHLPQPQFAVRMADNNPKVAKTAVNQSRKVSKGLPGSKDGSGTEDSGIGSQCYTTERGRNTDCVDSGTRSRSQSRPRNLRMVVNGKNFDVRDARDDDTTVTEISVIMLPKTYTSPNVNTGFVRERTAQYQRVLNKDNRYTDSTTSVSTTASMSTTSSEGYDEGLGEEKVYKDRSHTEKTPSLKSDFSTPSSDDPEYGHGEAMADEYSLSLSDEQLQRTAVSTVNANQHTSQHLKAITNVAKSGALPKSTLRSVLLTIEDPAFAAVAATSTTLIDDETSPVDSLFDSPTASITQSDGKTRRENPMAKSNSNSPEDDSPGTPTNASNSLSLSEGREYFDDEIADQPGLIFNDNARTPMAESVNAENTHTLVDSHTKSNTFHGKGIENSPFHGRKISRTGSVDTLSPCESIASDDLMLDYERSDASSYEEHTSKRDSNTALHDLDDATIISELEAQGEEVMRQWTSLLGTAQPQHQSNANTINNNINIGLANNNNHSLTESGTVGGRNSRLLRGSRSGAESPRSLDNIRTRNTSSPLRTPKNMQSPNLDSGDEGSVRMERDTYQYMFQDIVSIKTMLLKLKRVLQESEEKGLTRAETLNPFDNTMKNGLFYNLNEGNTTDVSTSPGNGENGFADELTDLRRQIVFLQGQLEDKDRTIQSLRFQVSKLQVSNSDSHKDTLSVNNGSTSFLNTCNAATQTDKIRPVSAGPSLLQSLPQDDHMGPLVSWSDSWNQRKSSDRSHSTVRPRYEQAFNKSIDENSPNRRPAILKEASQTKSVTNDAVKSFIPTAKRLPSMSLSPRTTKISVTGRSHNA